MSVGGRVGGGSTGGSNTLEAEILALSAAMEIHIGNVKCMLAIVDLISSLKPRRSKNGRFI